MMDALIGFLKGSEFLFVLELFAAEMLAFSGRHMRGSGWIRLLAGFAVTVTVAVAWHVSFSFFPIYVALSSLRYIVLFVLCTLSMYISFDCTVIEAVFFGLIGYTMQHMASNIAWLIAVGGFEDFLAEDFSRLGYVFTLPVCVVEYVLLYFVFLRRMRNKRIRVEGGRNISMLVIPSAVILLTSVVMGLAMLRLRIDYPSITIYHIVLCLVVFFLFASMFGSSRLMDKVDVIEDIVDKQKIYGERSESSINAINVKYHDLKKQLGAIAGAAASGSLEEYRRDIETQIGDYGDIADTGSEALNVVLTDYTERCRKAGIKFGYMADGALLSFMSFADIYSLFGNALDNCIEAVALLPEDERAIDLRIKREGGQVIVHVENYFAVRPVFDGAGKPITTKKDSSEHGFGTQSIRMIARKYGGTASMSVDGDIFMLDIMFPGR